MKSDTGKVLMVDPDGKMIVIQEGRAGSERLIHVIVDSDTRLKVNGEVIPIGNLPQEVKVGDVVFVRFLTPGDFRARRITIR
ncbi:MAG: hypothetical protein ABSC19_10300 [Syntrophorhabdales bacterium]|jgi:hypothetical protein